MSTKIVKKLLNDLEIDSYVINKESAASKQTASVHITEEESIEKLHKLQKTRFLCEKCSLCFFQGLFIKTWMVKNRAERFACF